MSKPDTRSAPLAGLADHMVPPLPHDLLASDPMAVVQAQHFPEHGHLMHLLKPKMIALAA